LIGVGRVSEAIEHFEHALRMTPASASVHNNLGAALAHAGRIAEAIEETKAALRLKPGDMEARNNLSKLEQMQKITPAEIQH
jgi:Flp pilus assembly protein TadD